MSHSNAIAPMLLLSNGGTRLIRCSSNAVLLVSLLAIASTPHDARASELARAPAPPTDAPSSPLQINVDSTIADAALWPQWLAERNPNVAHDLSLPGHEQWIEVRIDGATYDYRVTVTAIRDGEPVGPDTSPLSCECNTESLLSLLDREIANAIEQLRSTHVETGQPISPKPEPVLPEPEPIPDPEPIPGAAKAPRRWHVSPLGVGGAATGAFGLLALGAGVSLVVAEEREIPGRTKYYRELDPLGYTTLGVGLASLAAGITLVTIDMTRPSRRRGHARRHPSAAEPARPSQAPPRLTVSPLLNRRELGLACMQRF